LYFSQPSPIHALDPRVKIAWSVVVALLAMVLWQPVLLGALLAVSVLPWCFARPPLARLRWLFVLAGISVAGSVLSQGFFYRLEPRTEWWTIGLGLSLSKEGILYGGIVSLRLLSVLATGVLVIGTTYPSDLILAMTKLRVPQWFAFMLTLALRFLPETIEQTRRILIAQQLRGIGGKGVLAAAKRFRLLVVPLLAVLLRSARQVAMAAEVRAYSAHRVSSRELQFSRGDWIALTFMSLLMTFGITVACLGWFSSIGGGL
jgi:energy-coupling factor transport system permease protein